MTVEFKYRIGQIVAWTVFEQGQKRTDYGCIDARRVTYYGATDSNSIEYRVDDKWLSDHSSIRAVEVSEI